MNPTEHRHRALADFVLNEIIPVHAAIPGTFVLVGAVPQRESYFSLVKVLAVAKRTLDAVKVAASLVESEAYQRSSR